MTKMDGRSFGECEDRCNELLQDCLDVDGGGTAGCYFAWLFCMAGC